MTDQITIVEERPTVRITDGSPRGFPGPQGPAGPPGPPGPPGSASSFVFDQVAASALWDIVHNLGYRPNVTVVDSAGSRVEGDVVYVDDNELTVAFASPFAGQAYLS